MKFIDSSKKFIKKNETGIFTGFAIFFATASVVSAARATYKVCKQIEKLKKEKENVSKKEIFKTCWTNYIPTAIELGATIYCIVGCNMAWSKKNALLATSANLAQQALTEYRQQVKEKIGEKKESEIVKKTNDAVAEKTGISEIILDNDKEHLFKEPISERYFKSTWNKVFKAINELNSEALSDDGYITLDNYWNKLGLSTKGLYGNDMGWFVANGNGLLEADLTSSLTEDDRPCLSFYLNKEPKDIKI